jgi:two-component system response regulator HydG
VGGLKDIRVKIRIIAATNADIKEQIERGNFREDLYYRLNVIPIPLPPLRERGDDILLLAHFFLHNLQEEMKKHFHGFTPEACRKMLVHNWQGNIRELRNYIEREVIFTNSGWITLTSLISNNSANNQGSTTTNSTSLLNLRDMEEQYIKKVLNSVNNNKSKAARILGISRTTLREKI